MQTPGELVAEMSAPRFSTDFAMLSVTHAWEEPTDTQIFATTMPGAIGMCCGSRHANLRVTVQRWSGRPPDLADRWEDVDELPFEPLEDAGPLYIFGFDAPGQEGPELDVTGLGRSVARVCARGRAIADRVEEMEQTDELWLVQLWPDVHGRDPIDANPRVLKTPLEPAPTFAELERLTTVSNPYYHAFPAKWDVFHLVWWSPNRVLRTTPTAIAKRLNVSFEHVQGAIIALIRYHNVACDVDPYSIAPDDPIELRK